MPYRLLLLEEKPLGEPLTGFKCARGGERQLLPVSGNYPPIFLRDLIVAPVNGSHRVRIDKLEHHGVIARVLKIVLLSVKTGGIAEVTQKMNRATSVRLDFEHQPLPQSGFVEILRPLA